MNNLSGQQAKELHKALLSAFPNKPSLGRMLRFEEDIHLDHIAKDSNLADTVSDVIQYFESRSQIPKLLDAAIAENPDNLKLRNFKEKFEAERIIPVEKYATQPDEATIFGREVRLREHQKPRTVFSSGLERLGAKRWSILISSIFTLIIFSV